MLIMESEELTPLTAEIDQQGLVKNAKNVNTRKVKILEEDEKSDNKEECYEEDKEDDKAALGDEDEESDEEEAKEDEDEENEENEMSANLMSTDEADDEDEDDKDDEDDEELYSDKKKTSLDREGDSDDDCLNTLSLHRAAVAKDLEMVHDNGLNVSTSKSHGDEKRSKLSKEAASISENLNSVRRKVDDEDDDAEDEMDAVTGPNDSGTDNLIEETSGRPISCAIIAAVTLEDDPVNTLTIDDFQKEIEGYSSRNIEHTGVDLNKGIILPAPLLLNSIDQNKAASKSQTSKNSGVTLEVTKRRKEKLTSEPAPYIQRASEFLQVALEGRSKAWLQDWLNFENKKRGDVSNKIFGSKELRPKEISQFMRNHDYGKIEAVKDPERFSEEWHKMWRDVQPLWRLGTAPWPLKDQLSMPDQPEWTKLSKTGENGILLALVGLAIWNMSLTNARNKRKMGTDIEEALRDVDLVLQMMVVDWHVSDAEESVKKGKMGEKVGKKRKTSKSTNSGGHDENGPVPKKAKIARTRT